MKRRRTWTGALAGAAPFALAIVPGCSPYADYCAAWADCLGGNDADITACKEDLTGKAGYYLAYDCGEHWDEYVACIADKSECSTTATETKIYSDCDEQGLACKCASEESDLLECVENSSGYFEHTDPPPAGTTTATGT